MRRPPTLITHDGTTDTLRGWAQRTGLPFETLKSRIREERRAGRELDAARILRPSMWAEDDKPAIAAAAAAGTARRRSAQKARWAATLAELKSGPCADCGNRFHPVAMDFDHRDPAEKSFQISKGPKNLQRVLAEIAKCDLVCANCHRVRTWTKGHTTARRDRQPMAVTPALHIVAQPVVVARTESAAAEPLAEIEPVYGRGRGTKQERIDLLVRISLLKSADSESRIEARRLANAIGGGVSCEVAA